MRAGADVPRQPDVRPAPAAHPDPARGLGADAGEVLAAHLSALAARFLRALRPEDDAGREAVRPEASATASLRAAARRIAATVQTCEPLVDPAWAQALRTELGWLCAVVGREHRHAARLARLTAALTRLTADRTSAGGSTAVGAARAGALLERQLTLARHRAHSATLQAMGSARFHAVADAVTLLTSDVPLTAHAALPAAGTLPALTARVYRTLADAAGTLPLATAARPYNTQALRASLSGPAEAAPDPAGEPRDLAWHRVRSLARTCRYALELPEAVPPADGPDPDRLRDAGRALECHRVAAGAAEAAATAARTPRITPATAYALGVLHADQRAEVEAARYAFSTLWQPVAAATAR